MSADWREAAGTCTAAKASVRWPRDVPAPKLSNLWAGTWSSSFHWCGFRGLGRFKMFLYSNTTEDELPNYKDSQRTVTLWPRCFPSSWWKRPRRHTDRVLQAAWHGDLGGLEVENWLPPYSDPLCPVSISPGLSYAWGSFPEVLNSFPDSWFFSLIPWRGTRTL